MIPELKKKKKNANNPSSYQFPFQSRKDPGETSASKTTQFHRTALYPYLIMNLDADLFSSIQQTFRDLDKLFFP